MSKTLPVIVTEPELNPKVQADLDKVMAGVECLRVKSTVPQMKWIEEDVIKKEEWEQYKVNNTIGVVTGPMGGIMFVETRKNTSQPHNYQLTREAISLWD